MTLIDFQNILEAGGALVLPTETVYGLFAKALDEEAVEQVYTLKKRPKEKAMNLNVADFETILEYSIHQPTFLRKLYDAFLPGPLTIILQANEKVPSWINSGLGTVGFRVPNHDKTLELIRSQKVLIGPSANISGTDSGLIFDDIIVAFDQKVTGIADDPALTGFDSTILDLSGERAKILRQGKITKEELEDAVPELVF